MAFLVDEKTRPVIQGMTGRLGIFSLALMRAGGTEAIAGVTPGKGGQAIDGVPIFDTVEEARDHAGANASIIFVPAALLEDAVLEAIAAGMDPIVAMVDGVPIDSSLRIVSEARRCGVDLIGPNSPGVISPGRGILAALRADFFSRGRVAVVSRSGGMMSTIAYTLTSAGIGQSTCVGVGGDSLIGLDMVGAALMAEADPETEAIVIFGELGTSQEHRLAAAVRDGLIRKPVIAYIAGTAAPTGIRYSHAGARSEYDNETAASKRAVLAAAGAVVVDRYVDIPDAIRSQLVLSGD